MGLATVQFHSPALGKGVTYNVILPEEGDGPFPVLLQLHGLSDDQNAWLQRANLVRHAAAYPLLVVLPDGGTSGYLNWRSPERMGKQRYEDFVMDDLAAHVARHFHVRPGPWAIGGLSMGGYGAMRLGLKYPERFASVWAHSSAFRMDDLIGPGFLEDAADARLWPHADRAAAQGVFPEIAFDCGVSDHQIETNRAFHAHLNEIGLPHHYAEHAGNHDWDYWDAHVPEALRQHARILGVG